MLPATPDRLQRVLDATVDGVLVTEANGATVLANRPFAALADALGLGLDGVFTDRLLELADRTAEPYAFTAAVERLGASARRLEFEDAAAGRAFALHVSAPDPELGRVWTLREVTDEHERQRARDEFVATVGHELRTPLTSMSGFLELLADGDAGPLTAEQARYVEIVQRATGRLHALVDELLERSDERETTKKGTG
ncbi:MAG TPA: histidine kinase dimerization/phospho-acceptor domain-containing protein [Gaiellaceae bacterium]|nr:histidine kinase dimerization/phospho-acceptor domain-containing protein [Gaiellaceae bacterium]